MTDYPIVPAQASSGVQAVDSLSANEFNLEIQGEKMPGIFRVSGLVSFKLDVKTTTTLKEIKEPITIVKMVQRDPENAFNVWMRETVSARTDILRPKRTVSLVAVDDGVEIRRWIIKGAWISEISYSEFDTGSGELIEETLVIQWDELEESWLLG